MEIDLLGAKTINKSDLIQSLRNVSALATLYQSLVSIQNIIGWNLAHLLLDLAQASVGRAQVGIRGSDLSYAGGRLLSLPFHTDHPKTAASSTSASTATKFIIESTPAPTVSCDGIVGIFTNESTI